MGNADGLAFMKLAAPALPCTDQVFAPPHIATLLVPLAAPTPILWTVNRSVNFDVRGRTAAAARSSAALAGFASKA